MTASIHEGETVSRWNFDVTNNGDRAIRQAICPQVTSIGPLADDGSNTLYIPSRLRRAYADPTNLGYSLVHRYPSGFGTMQFVAYLADQTGLYAAAEDTDGHAKRLEFIPRQGIVGYRATHLIPYRPGEDVTLPYSMVLGTHAGGWREACDR